MRDGSGKPFRKKEWFFGSTSFGTPFLAIALDEVVWDHRRFGGTELRVNSSAHGAESRGFFISFGPAPGSTPPTEMTCRLDGSWQPEEFSRCLREIG
jgi:hypothetical protein